ncbi:MAG: 23S rRNA (guanosine(2251)-2'-O)-methyltransferase RlmB [Vulcanimicrobiaceae bacterium]
MERRQLKRPPSRPADRRKDEDIVYGLHAVREALVVGDRLRIVHVAQERVRDQAVRAILKLAQEAAVSVELQPYGYFARFPFKAHQGVVAVGEPFAYADLHEVLRRRTGDRPALFVLLDHVTDPQNLGAILRTAECVGADAVILPERRAAGVTATARKAAAGASEHIPVVQVANLAEAIRTLKKAGIWVAGADAGPDCLMMSAADMARDVALVIGAEGSGLTQLVRRECDFLVAIPLFGRTSSLNASVAAGVLLYETLRQRKMFTSEAVRVLDDGGDSFYNH